MLLNVREVAGMAARDGRAVRPGVLFRGGAVDCAADAERLRQQGVSMACDLRARHEQARSPSALRACGMAHPVPVHDIDIAAPLRMLRQQGATVAASREAMIGVYDRMPRMFRPVLTSALTALAGADGPAYVHCAIGKDRTGVTIALLLAVLGVARDEIMQDYLATNRAFDDICRHVGLRDGGTGGVIAPETVPLLVADADYLNRFLAHVGEARVYARDALGLTDAGIEALQDRFLA